MILSLRLPGGWVVAGFGSVLNSRATRGSEGQHVDQAVVVFLRTSCRRPPYRDSSQSTERPEKEITFTNSIPILRNYPKQYTMWRSPAGTVSPAVGSHRRLHASSTEPRYSKVLSSPVPDPALDSSDHLYQQATPEKTSIGAEYYASPRRRSGVKTHDAGGCSSNDRSALTLGQEVAVLAVLVESLAIGAEPGDHWHVGAVY